MTWPISSDFHIFCLHLLTFLRSLDPTRASRLMQPKPRPLCGVPLKWPQHGGKVATGPWGKPSEHILVDFFLGFWWILWYFLGIKNGDLAYGTNIAIERSIIFNWENSLETTINGNFPMKSRHLSIAMLRYQRVCPIKWDTLISILVSDESMLELSSFRPMLHGLFRMWSIWRWAVLGTEGRFRLHCVLQLPSDGMSLLRVHVFGRERCHRQGHEDLEVWTLGSLQRSTEHQWICWFSSAFQWLWARKEANCRGIHVFP